MKELKLPYIIMQHILSNLSGYFHSIVRTAPDRKKSRTWVSDHRCLPHRLCTPFLVYSLCTVQIIRSVPFRSVLLLVHRWVHGTLVAGISLKKIDGASWVPACRARRALSRSDAGIRAVLYVFQVSKFPFHEITSAEQYAPS